MRIAIVGPQQSIVRVRDVITEKVPFLEYLEAPYTSLSDVPGLLKKYQSQVNGVLFTGQTPFQYACHHCTATVPWEFLPRNMVSTLCALVQAGYLNGYDIRNISSDGFADGILQQVYREIGFTSDEIHIYSCPTSVSEENYYEKVASFHSDLYNAKRVGLCITGLSTVYQLLRSQKIPAVKVSANAENILEKVNSLRLAHEMHTSEENRIAVTAVKISSFQEYSVNARNELQQLQQENKSGEMVYLLAMKMGAAIVQQAQVYYLFTTKHQIERETQGFKRIPLLSSILSVNPNASVAIGVGLGKNAGEAKRNADLCRGKAERYGVACFVLNENDQMIGPITEGLSKHKPTIIDQNLYLISKKTSIGIDTLHLLEQTQRQYDLRETTPSELAKLCGFPLRSMNRLLKKLEDAGYVMVVGKGSNPGPVRPSRIIRLRLTERI